MMKKIKSIEIAFENCESMIIPRNCIGTFLIDGIHETIKRVGMNVIAKYSTIDEFVIEIYKEGDEVYYPFGDTGDEQSKFKRLTDFNDISSISVIYEDGDMEEFYVPYDCDDSVGAPNRFQDTYISELGNLYISIHALNRIIEYFDLTEINEKETVERTKDLLDVGIEEETMYKFERDNLPEMYRYVYLYVDDENTQTHNCTLAVRVYDEDSGWKFIFKGGNPVICPTSWKYPNSKIDKFIDSEGYSADINWKMGDIINKYPVPDEIEDESEYAKEARLAISKAKERYKKLDKNSG